MNKQLFVLLLSMFIIQIVFAQVPLQRGMKINKSVRIKRGVYKLDGYDSLGRSVILIEGNNITVDFNNAVLTGSNQKQTPDQFYGVALIVRNGKNITVKNLTAKGYKIALLARNVTGLRVENCDFSYNYRQHLNSTQEKEDISDWMSYHHNEQDEWLRYGAGIYLRSCDSSTIKNCRISSGQNALMMMECNDGMIYNNDFSFNSGIGLGMYRSNNNKVLYNKINFNVRGYSDGVYNRGQDSAGILVYEQSNGNLFYKNSVTHGGDGFFLWAGQTTMDTGQGGCNDNLILDNDFSYAPTNGVELTFSRNKVIHNRIFECDHGIWGGYSFDSDISRNQFRFNRIAIAIEHGQDNNIYNNIFYRDKEAIRLWANKEQSQDWGYPKYRDTRSRDYNFTLNSFNNNSVVFNLKQTDSINIFNNRLSDCETEIEMDSTVTNLDTLGTDRLDIQFSEESKIDVPEIVHPIDPFKGLGKLSGRKNIMITEWGPYNFNYPIIWNTNPTDTSGILQFDILGPKGKWKIVSYKGLEGISKMADSFPAHITAKKVQADRTDIELVAAYLGSSFIDQFGRKINANIPNHFSFKKFFQPINWEVRWYGLDSTFKSLPDSAQVENIFNLQPISTEKTQKLDYAWWGGIKAGNKLYDRFLTVAEGKVNLPEGNYELGVTWDDAIRVYIDGKRVIDEWNPSLYKFDESPHKTVKVKLAGQHHIRVEHVELGGFATLNFKLEKI